MASSKRSWRFIAEIPSEAGKFVNMCVFRSSVYIACEWKVYMLTDNDELVEIMTHGPTPVPAQ